MLKTIYIFVVLITCIGNPNNAHSKNIVPNGCGQFILTDARHKHTACGDVCNVMKNQLELDLSVKMDEEIWKDIIGYEGSYQVSNFGQVKSFRTGKILYLGTDKRKSKGYKLVCLCKENKKKTFSVHRLVAIAFISNPENKPEVNHRNGVTSKNFVENLEWCTRSENELHAWNILKRVHPRNRKIQQLDPKTGEVFKWRFV